MKKPVFVLLFLCAFGALADHPEGEGITPVDKLYVPHGFDDNDVVEAVVSGHFKDSCHQLSRVNLNINEATKTVELTPVSYSVGSDSCIQMISPFIQVVKLGRLAAGSYTFKVAQNPQVTEQVNVALAQVSERDDFLYPPVEQVELEKDRFGTSYLTLKGRYPQLKRGCMSTEEAVVDLQEGQMLVVQPKSRVVEAGDLGCEKEYEKTFRLPFENLQGKMLVHVRAINGDAYNKVISLY